MADIQHFVRSTFNRELPRQTGAVSREIRQADLAKAFLLTDYNCYLKKQGPTKREKWLQLQLVGAFLLVRD